MKRKPDKKEEPPGPECPEHADCTDCENDICGGREGGHWINRALKQADRRHICQNCAKIWFEGQIKVVMADIEDFFSRVNPGEIIPSGECPECGALLHPYKPPREDGLDTRGRVVRNMALMMANRLDEVTFKDIWGEELGQHFWRKHLSRLDPGDKWNMRAFNSMVLELDLGNYRVLGEYLDTKYGKGN